MRRSLLTTLGTALISSLVSILFSTTAYAYLTPEQVLELNGDASIVAGNQRASDTIISQQDAAAAGRHPITIQPYNSTVAQNDNGTTHAAPPDISVTQSSSSAGNSLVLQLDPVTLRLLVRLQAEKNGQNAVGTYHAGAPLTPSGPAGDVTAIVMIGSVVWTIWRAKRMEKIRE